MTEREKEILALIRVNPLISQKECADKLGITRSAAAGHIMNLTRKGYIRGKGYILQEEPYAVVIGGANMDIQGTSLKKLIPEDSNPGHLGLSCGGVGRNIAENMARMGSSVRFISIVGDDAFGKKLLSDTGASGVDVSPCLTLPGHSTSTYLSIHEPGGEMALALNHMELLDRLTVEAVQRHAHLIRQASLIVIDTNLRQDLIDYLFTAFPENTFFADPVSVTKSVKLKNHLGRLRYFKPNRLEAEALCGFPVKTEREFHRAADFFFSKGIPELVISRGDKGLFCKTAEGAFTLPRPDARVVNVTGAGDAFVAGLGTAFLAQKTFREALNIAQAAARLTLEQEQTVNPALNLHSIQSLLEEKT